MSKIMIFYKIVRKFFIFPFQQNNILEVCIAKYWSNFGTTTLNASIEFHGVRANLPSKL